jgi:hypothetical protein
MDGTLLRGLTPEEVHAKLLDFMQPGEIHEGVREFRRTVWNTFAKMQGKRGRK